MKRAWLVVCVAAVLASVAALPSSASALVPNGTHGWFWQMPQPAVGLNDVAFPGDGQVWAVGAGGLILHSTDAGATWASQTSNTDADLWSVSFADGLHGLAVGGQATAAAPGVILATSDGGTWVDKTPGGLTGSLTNANVVDATNAWVGTTDGKVLKTTDGGDSWRTLTPAAAYKNTTTVDFIDAGHGWVGGTQGRIWRTADGGRTWTMSRFGRWDLVQLDFVNQRDGWALAQDDWGDSFVLATFDGGRFWQPMSTGDVFVTGMCATSASNVWLIGQSWMDWYDLQSPTMFRHTTDGGRHWTTSTVTAPAMPYVVGASGRSVCAVGDGILISGDAGATWQSASSGQQYQFAAATAVGASDVWAVDTSGALLHAADGVHFVEQPVPARGDTALMGVSFPDASDGWIVGTGDIWGDGSVIFHTSDGGATWDPQQSNLSGGLVGVDFVDADNGWAVSNDNSGWNVGANVTLQHTTDGGATWIPQFVPGNVPLTAVDFLPDAATGWVVGGQYTDYDYPTGAIFSTTDGGLVWTKEKLPKGTPAPTGLQFVNASDGWAVGESYDQNDDAEQSWVLQTTDGGATWVRRTDLNDTLATTVHFSDASHGWLGGLDGVYATTDGGATWQRVATGYGVEAIAAADPQHVWAFGDGFMTSTLDASGDTAAPVTLDEHNDVGWHRKPFTIDFSANDIGGSGVGGTQTSFDGNAWQAGASIAVPAAADHHNDGQHTVRYRSIDNAGNQEQTETKTVDIDTLGPACSVPYTAVVDSGSRGALRFLATDTMSGVARATIDIVGARGRVLRSIHLRSGDWGSFPPPSYYWIRFTCNLKPGDYRIVVHAVDSAGNHQVTVGHGRLRVVRSGAPHFRPPWWPSGLPSSFFGERLNHGLKPAWLLRLNAKAPVVRAAVRRGAWKARHWPEIRLPH